MIVALHAAFAFRREGMDGSPHPFGKIGMGPTNPAAAGAPVVTVPRIHENDCSVIRPVPDATPQRLRDCPIGLLRIKFSSGKKAGIFAKLALFVVVGLLGLDAPVRPVGQGHADADHSSRIVIIERDSFRHFAAKDCEQNAASSSSDRVPKVVPCGFKVFLASRRFNNDFSLASQKALPDEIVVVVTVVVVASIWIPARYTLFEKGIGRKKYQTSASGDSLDHRSDSMAKFGQEGGIVVVIAVRDG
mmetsp:Transcript_20951/g.43138  ORF Transcript_20951/g.43138 Transcript_20951/m.43138 type:complete len:246 (-) Transcript_20951:44-781(-)